MKRATLNTLVGLVLLGTAASGAAADRDDPNPPVRYDHGIPVFALAPVQVTVSRAALKAAGRPHADVAPQVAMQGRAHRHAERAQCGNDVAAPRLTAMRLADR